MSRRRLIYSWFILVTVLLCSAIQSKATHMYGADLFYTHISGNKYKVSLYIYGDCSGNAFPNLPGNPVVRVLNGNSLFRTLTLKVEAPTNGLEVTPVCPAEIGNTKCSSLSNTIPGVKRFTYSDTVTLNTTSTNWRFRFTGAMGSTSAGRSNGITNIANGTTMNLEATLNNTSVVNSSPTYTTIPTPFFCINKFVNYNNGAIDANGDSLVYSLVAGLNNSGTVNYNTGYSATSPLAVATGSFSFNTATGQLAFLPNLLQKSLVVIRVDEYRNGVLIGTSMREMTFIIANCANNPPIGLITNNNRGTISNNGTKISVCKPIDTLRFNINPTDLDTAHKISISYTGLPAGATLAVTNNNTTSPISIFTWKTTNIAPGSYNFFVTYVDDGCPIVSKQTMAYTIDILPEPKAVVTITRNATCTKKAVINITPAISPSNWQIQVKQGTTVLHTFNNVTGTQIDSLTPGTYSIRTTNADSCFWDTSIVITAPPPVGINVVANEIKCFGDTSGKLTVTGTGGQGSFTYAINSGSFTSNNSFTGLNAGTYILKAKDTNDCIKDTSVSLANPNPLIPKASVKSSTCNTLGDGRIIISVTGGTSPYTYAMGSGTHSSNSTFSPLSSGSYTFSIKDSNSCSADTTISITDSLLITASYTLNNALCADSSSGSILTVASGGSSPYTYAINNGTYGSNNNFTSLNAGNYTIKIKDSFDCKKDSTLTISEPQPVSISVTSTNPLCHSDSNGTITITATGGTTPYQYAVGNNSFSNTNIFNNIPAGNYAVKIRDTNNCYKDTTLEIKEPTKVAQTVAITDVKCFGGTSGIVIANGNGGTSPYTYAINSGLFTSTSTFTNLSANTYTIRTKDTNGCIKDTLITVTQPDKIKPIASVKNSTCETLNDGKVIISATGGISPYTFAIGSGSFITTSTFNPLNTGSYLFKIKDANDCIVDTTIAISDSIKIAARLTLTDALCKDSSSGSVTVVANNGTSPYQYAINSGTYSTTNPITNLKAGAYAISIKDSFGCKLDTNFNISEPNKVNITVSYNNPKCYNEADGLISIAGTGGTSPYQYALNNNTYNSNNNYTNLSAGNYTVKVKDTNNCIADTTVNLINPDALNFTFDLTNVKCFGESSGAVTVNGSGGIPAYTYAYDGRGFQTQPILTGLDGGRHVIKMRDSKGCLKDSSISLSEPPALSITEAQILDATCEGMENGAVTLKGKGGTQPYTYAIDNGTFDNQSTKLGLKEGTYTISIKDNNNCRIDSTILIEGYPHIILNDVVASPVSCFGYTDGSLDIKVTGGTPSFKYQLDANPITDDKLFNNLSAGSYTITVEDSLGCKKDTTLVIESPEKLSIETKVTPNDCDGIDNSGTITAKVTGGTAPYRYSWSNDSLLKTERITGIANGKYIVIVTDLNECSESIESTITYDNCCTIFIPDAFTPNNDGRNDYARILNKGEFTLEVFSIYNRFGERVFTTDDINAGWDGIHNGEKQDLGTYFYFAKGLCGNERKVPVLYKGTITLIK
ncbi:MAG: gliding motility-associated C-terminal domain-containing protein [Flavipsychrobacter sp.]